MSVPAREPEPLSLDEVKEQLVVKGRERGFVTSEDLLEAVPVDDFTPEQVEEFLTQVEEHLTAEGIEVVEVPGEDTDAATQVRIEVDLLRAPDERPGPDVPQGDRQGPAPQRGAGGRPGACGSRPASCRTALQHQTAEDGKPEPEGHEVHASRRSWEIRDHQLTRRVRQGRGHRRASKIAKSYRPKTEPELDELLPARRARRPARQEAS